MILIESIIWKMEDGRIGVEEGGCDSLIWCNLTRTRTWSVLRLALVISWFGLEWSGLSCGMD